MPCIHLRIYTNFKWVPTLCSCILYLLSLWIYTALKPTQPSPRRNLVCYSYEFTLLSNLEDLSNTVDAVCYPYEFTLLSNPTPSRSPNFSVCYPYEFTLLSNIHLLVLHRISVCYPYEFTLLSNQKKRCTRLVQFVIPMNLHCSQTSKANETSEK